MTEKKTTRIMENQNKPKEKRRRKHLGARVPLSQLKQMGETGWTMPLHPRPLEHHNDGDNDNVNNNIDDSDNDTDDNMLDGANPS